MAAINPSSFKDDTSAITINAFLKQLQLEPANTFIRRLVIIDPDYTGKTGAVRRVKDLKGLGLFRQLFRFITGGSGERVSGETCCRRAISEIRIGHTGFGVANLGKCVAMGAEFCSEWMSNGVV